jgi:ribosome biogenesis SPOUT family RNA methylase Rps3
MKYIIEHLEPKLSKWCMLEYNNISQKIGKDNLIFTNIKNKKDREKLKKISKVYTKSIKDLKFENSCVLDPNAKQTLNPKDKNNFSYLIFGGILGDYPPKNRTEEEITKFLNYPARNMKDKQMSTDTAVIVAKKIIDGTPFEKLNFIDEVSIEMNEYESVDLPYRYLSEKNKPVITPGLVTYLKKKQSF